MHTLLRLRLRLECGWPLCLVASDEMLQQYNAVLVLLMQVGRVGLVLWVRQPEACMGVGVVSGRCFVPGIEPKEGARLAHSGSPLHVSFPWRRPTG